MNFDASSSSFTRLGSFRQATITERLQDPQVKGNSQKSIMMIFYVNDRNKELKYISNVFQIYLLTLNGRY